MEVSLGASRQGLSPRDMFSSAAPATVTITSSMLNDFIMQNGFSSYPSTMVDTYYVQPSGYFAPSADPSSPHFMDAENAQYLSSTSPGFNPSVSNEPSTTIDEANSYALSSTAPWWGSSSIAPYASSSSQSWNPNVNTDSGWDPESVTSSTDPFSLGSGLNAITDSSSSIASDWWLSVSGSFYGSSSGTFSTWTPTSSEVIASATSNDILNSLSSIVYNPSTWTASNDIQNSDSYVYPPTSATLQLTGPSSASGSSEELNNVETSSSSLSIGETSAYSYSSQYPSMEGSSYLSSTAEGYASTDGSYYLSSHATYDPTYPTPNVFSSSYSYWDSTTSPLSGWYSSWFLSPPITVLPSASSEGSIVTTPYPSVVPSSVVSFSAPRPPISLSTPTPTAFTSESSTSAIPTPLTYPMSSPLVDTTSSFPSSYEANIYSSSQWQPSIGSEITPPTSSSLTPTLVAATSNIVPITTSFLPSASTQVTDDSSGSEAATSASVGQQSDSYFDGFTTTTPAIYSSILQTPVVTPSSSYESLPTSSDLANIENAISPSLSLNPSSSTGTSPISASLSPTSLGFQAITTSSSPSISLAIATSISSSSLQATTTSSSSSRLQATTTTSSSSSRLQTTTTTSSSSSRLQTTAISSSSRLRAIITSSSSSRLQETTTFSPSTSSTRRTTSSSASSRLTSSSSLTSSALKTTGSSSSFFSKSSHSPYFPTSDNSSSYRSSTSMVLSHSTSSMSPYNTSSSSVKSRYKISASSQSRNNTSTSRSASSINTGYSVSYGTKTAYYIYTQTYVITGSSTTFGTGVPTTVNEPRSMSSTFSAPRTIITQNFAFYEHLIHNLRSGNNHDHSHTGAIVGGVVGGVCGFVVGCLVIATFFLLRRLRKQKRKNAEGPGEFTGEIGSRLANRTPPRTSTDNLQEKPDDSPDINPREENEQLSSRRIPRGSVEGERTNPENPFRDEFNFKGRSLTRDQPTPPPVPPPRKMHSTSQHPIQSRNANLSRDIRSSLVSSLGDSSLASSLQGDCSTLSSGAIRLEPSSYGGSIPEDPEGGFFREVI